MKIEMGESLIFSWLRHEKQCQLVQLNWKPSINTWPIYNELVLERIMSDTSRVFAEKYGLDIFKKNGKTSQLIQQGEIDVLGVHVTDGPLQIYGMDVAFHENGLNYGSKEETAARVVKKLIRTAMIIYGYFNLHSAQITFASPKIHDNVLSVLEPCIDELNVFVKQFDLNYTFTLFANDNFKEIILDRVIEYSRSISDTSELFMRSIQMNNMFSSTEKSVDSRTIKGAERSLSEDKTKSDSDRQKIGALVRSTLTSMFQRNGISPEEVALMQTSQYSKDTFHIQYPLLVKASLSNGEKVNRYWKDPVWIYGEPYFICSEWFEVPQNNDRPYFMKWLGLKKQEEHNE